MNELYVRFLQRCKFGIFSCLRNNHLVHFKGSRKGAFRNPIILRVIGFHLYLIRDSLLHVSPLASSSGIIGAVAIAATAVSQMRICE